MSGQNQLPPGAAALAAMLPDALFCFDGEGRCLFANEVALELVGEFLGVPEPDVEGMPWAELGFAEGPLLEWRSREVLEQGRPQRFGLEIPLAGRARHFQVVLDRLAQPAPQLMALLRDVSASFETGLAHNTWRTVLDTTDDAIITQTLDGTILSWNRGAEQIYGYAASEMIGSPISRLVPPERKDEVTRILATVRRGARAENLSTEGVRKDGSRVGIVLTVSPIRDAEDQIAAASVIGRDITDLRKAEVRSQALLEAAPDAMVVADENGRIVTANSQTERLFGYPRPALLGQPVELLVPTRSRESHVAHRRGYMANPTPRPMGVGLELTALRADGTELPVEISLSSLRTDEGLLVSAAIRDTTARRAIEAEIRAAQEGAERANRAKNEFLSGMSHELRTPLNAILGFAQLLEIDGLEAGQEEPVRLLLRAGRHLLTLIDEVLDISRIEVGGLALSIEPVSVESAVAEALELVGPMASAAGVKLHVRPERVGIHVQADRQRLQQVLLNLASNAVKYNRAGGEATFEWFANEADDIRIEVRDTGVGIPEGLMDRLFVPFERLGAQGGNVQGTGLGLALSRGLVEAMGGRIGAQSTVGRGSTFWCEFPASTPLELHVDSRPERRGVSSAEPLDAKVLYVEDNLSNLKLVEQILVHRPGVQLLSTMQGSLALELAIEHQPDLLLLDLHLPDLPGEEVLRRWRADPATAEIPVVVVSADATAERPTDLIAAGADEYVTKPLDVALFLEVVDAQLQRSRQRRS